MTDGVFSLGAQTIGDFPGVVVLADISGGIQAGAQINVLIQSCLATHVQSKSYLMPDEVNHRCI